MQCEWANEWALSERSKRRKRKEEIEYHEPTPNEFNEWLDFSPPTLNEGYDSIKKIVSPLRAFVRSESDAFNSHGLIIDAAAILHSHPHSHLLSLFPPAANIILDYHSSYPHSKIIVVIDEGSIFPGYLQLFALEVENQELLVRRYRKQIRKELEKIGCLVEVVRCNYDHSPLFSSSFFVPPNFGMLAWIHHHFSLSLPLTLLIVEKNSRFYPWTKYLKYALASKFFVDNPWSLDSRLRRLVVNGTEELPDFLKNIEFVCRKSEEDESDSEEEIEQLQQLSNEHISGDGNLRVFFSVFDPSFLKEPVKEKTEMTGDKRLLTPRKNQELLSPQTRKRRRSLPLWLSPIKEEQETVNTNTCKQGVKVEKECEDLNEDTQNDFLELTQSSQDLQTTLAQPLLKKQKLTDSTQQDFFFSLSENSSLSEEKETEETEETEIELELTEMEEGGDSAKNNLTQNETQTQLSATFQDETLDIFSNTAMDDKQTQSQGSGKQPTILEYFVPSNSLGEEKDTENESQTSHSEDTTSELCLPLSSPPLLPSSLSPSLLEQTDDKPGTKEKEEPPKKKRKVSLKANYLVVVFFNDSL
eukprot:CAMPEP_0174254898 /NCGR_PEP_ID=MMETSP0439-20130205/4243_1 /TAXON_ID=0 /ORGANISM="Stereomyxa ramosa, Strain Chinc5" /LENGTH=584 /DNA_ID=CAMNT_0015336787 /DNA_START=465 /DNA_END=2216 /DNA_ORIENTATION=-